MASNRHRKGRSQAAPVILILLLFGMIAAGFIFILQSLSARRDAEHGNVLSAESAAESIPSPALPETTTVPETTTETTTTTTTTARFPSAPFPTEETVTVSDTELLIARNALLVHPESDGSIRILAQREPDARAYPASLTKIMTMVTFLELVPESDLTEKITMQQAVIDAQTARSAHVSGIQGGEECSLIDLLYELMLPSSADAAVMLAVYASGSEEAFVGRMNALAAEMGLVNTHFVNCTGLHDDDHYTTASELSRILLYALKNPVCRRIMSVKRYTTAPTPQHPEGLSLMSTVLYRMNGDELERDICGAFQVRRPRQSKGEPPKQNAPPLRHQRWDRPGR